MLGGIDLLKACDSLSNLPVFATAKNTDDCILNRVKNAGNGFKVLEVEVCKVFSLIIASRPAIY